MRLGLAVTRRRVAYNKQTQDAQAKGKSNCPLCAVGKNAKEGRIYKLDEIYANRVYPSSKRRVSAPKNCQMPCTTHDRAKRNG